MSAHYWPCLFCPLARETLDEVERHEHSRHNVPAASGGTVLPRRPAGRTNRKRQR